MIKDHKGEKMNSLIRELAAEFLGRESGRTSLITVTRVNLSSNKKYATIFFTVFPEDKEKAALDFVHRKISDFRKFVQDNSRIGKIPFFSFEIDYGEKNRQRLDEISANKVKTRA